MPRALLDPCCYHGWLEVPTRYADMDANGHVNNVAMARLFEEGRVRFLSPMLQQQAADMRIVVASLEIEYLAETRYPEPIRLGLGIVDIGRSSWAFAQLAMQHGRAVAAARTTTVGLVDGRPAPIGAALRAMLEQARLLTGAAADAGPAAPPSS
jgi:acyl-CoA thioester hydrolase